MQKPASQAEQGEDTWRERNIIQQRETVETAKRNKEKNSSSNINLGSVTHRGKVMGESSHYLPAVTPNLAYGQSYGVVRRRSKVVVEQKERDNIM